MSLEDRIGQSLDQGLARLDATPRDLAEVQRRGRDVRRRRVAVAVAAAAVVAGAAIVLPNLGDDDRVEPAPPTGTWEQLPPAPLSGRWSALATWTGEEVLVVGGGVSTPCPPTASCTDPDVMARDGAAYDPDSRTWRTIAKAPIPMEYWFRTTMVDDTMVVLAALEGGSRWFAYDVSDDAWRELPTPERKVMDWGRIPSLDGRVFALSKSGQVQVLDLATETWSELPPSRLGPPLDPHSVLPTPVGVFVSGTDVTVEVDGDAPSYIRVERWDGAEWTRYPETGQIGGFQHWTGSRLITADIQTATGLRGHPPYGGVLDPASGRWSPLPNAPDAEDPLEEGWSPDAADGPLVAGWGRVYDDRTERWSAIGKPDSGVDSSQAAVWVGDRLFVFGGVDEETGYEDVSGLSNDAWVWTH